MHSDFLSPRCRFSFTSFARGSAAALLLATLGGCGSSLHPSLGAISVTDASGATTGQLTSVVIGTKAAVSVQVTGDPENLGVNFVASCLGSPVSPPVANPCGTLASAFAGSANNAIYTAPAYVPVGNTVTLTARGTSDPSLSSSVTITIAPRPITINLTTPPPAQLGAGASVVLSATVTNDAVAAGINWAATCSSASCGTFASGLTNPNQTASGGQISYTAPAIIPGGPVTINAASISDPSKTVSATVTIAPVSIAVTPSPLSVPLGTQGSLIATTTFDSAGKGVDWSAPVCGSPGACGSLSSTHTASGAANIYTPPAAIPAGGGTVSITATATANPAAQASDIITIVLPPPIAISVTPAAAMAQINGSANLIATLTNDQANAGVDWTLTCRAATLAACGTIAPHTASGSATTYVAPAAIPAGGTVTATATSTTDPTKSASSMIAIDPSIAIAFAPAPPATVSAGVAGSFTATVTNDVNAAGVDWSVTCASPPCGTFASGNAAGPSHTASGAPISFTAPAAAAAGTVTITATSTASVTALPVRSVSTIATVVPIIAVNFIPFAPTQLQSSDSTLLAPPPYKLLAGVSNDSTNAGIDWSVCNTASTCGQFQITPALAATATTVAVNATYSNTVHTNSGQPVFYVPPSTPPAGGSVTVTARAHNPAATSTLATATANIVISKAPTGVALQGTVLAGTAPVVGAKVFLYAAGTTGYSSAASPLTLANNVSNAVTDGAGTFSIPAGFTCPQQSSQIYLVALGGKVGANAANPNLSMMTALGTCSGLSSSASIVINEVTTVGSVWALSPFMSDYSRVGSSAANSTVGLANAFQQVTNLVNITTGVALNLTPAGNGSVPQAEINTLADILNTCTASSGGSVGDGSKCGALFNASNPGAVNANAPVETIKAGLNIAQTPSFNTNPGPGSLYSLLPAAGAPFLPGLAASPNDWTVALSFTGGGLASRSAANALAIDQAGNVWLSNSRFASVTELTNQGAALSPFGTGTTMATAGGFQGAAINFSDAINIDPLGNAWVANANGSIGELPAGIAATYTAPLTTQPFTGGGLSGTVRGLTIDGTGNIWTVSGGSPGELSWFAGASSTLNGTAMAPGTPLSPAAGYTQGISTPTAAMGVDTSGTVWLLNSGSNSAAEYNSANGSFIQSDFGYAQTVPTPMNSVLSGGVGTQLTIDNPGNVYLSVSGQLITLKTGGSSANAGGLGTQSPATGNTYSQFLALDGTGRVYLLITGGSNFCPSSYSVVVLNTAGTPQNINYTGCGYLGTGVGPTDAALAVDSTGNLWVLNSGAITQFIGLASPVVTPFATGVANKTLGTRP